MKAVLEFTLPEEQDEHQLAVNAWKWQGAFLEIRELVRQWLKYGHDFKNAEQVLEAIKNHMIDEMNERGLGE